MTASVCLFGLTAMIMLMLLMVIVRWFLTWGVGMGGRLLRAVDIWLIRALTRLVPYLS